MALTAMEIRDRVKELRRVRAGDLLANPKNWRTHPPAQQQAVAGLLAEIGYADALLARETPKGLMLLDGHLRAEATPDTTVPVLVVDLDDAEADKLLLTLDPLGAMAGADKDALTALLESVSFEADGVQKLLDDLAKDHRIVLPAMAGRTDPDDAPELPAEPTTKPGDLWLMGGHRLLCGDATNREDVERLLGGDKPLLTVTDPPYGVAYYPAWRNEAAEKGLISYATSRVGEVTNDSRTDWQEAWALSPSDVIYCWHAGRHASTVQRNIEDEGFEVRCQIIWAKQTFAISRGHYHWRHEPCWYAVRNGATAHWVGDHSQSTLWEITWDKNVEGGHSTQKPVECMERPIRNHDTKDVYDPFLGSGTTLIAAERLGRRCYGMDIDPRYVDVAVKRWEDFTGEKAVLA